MNLSRTIILPTDDPALARSIYSHQIHGQPRILLTIHGRDLAAQSLVEDADQIASSQQGYWWIIWARQPSDIAPIVAQLTCPDELKPHLPDSRAFATSRTDVVKDVIGAAEPAPDYTRIWQAFARAEAT